MRFPEATAALVGVLKKRVARPLLFDQPVRIILQAREHVRARGREELHDFAFFAIPDLVLDSAGDEHQGPGFAAGVFTGAEFVIEPAFHQPGDLLVGVRMGGNMTAGVEPRPEAHNLFAAENLDLAEIRFMNGQIVELMNKGGQVLGYIGLSSVVSGAWLFRDAPR